MKKSLLESQKRIFEIMESFNSNTDDERYKNLIDFIKKPGHHLTYLRTTDSIENAIVICKQGLIFEDFRNTTDYVPDVVSLIYMLLIRKQYGNYTVIIQINEDIKDRTYEEISGPNGEEGFILPPEYIRGYYNRKTEEIFENPLFGN